jgi:hypothetical protein
VVLFTALEEGNGTKVDFELLVNFSFRFQRLKMTVVDYNHSENTNIEHEDLLLFHPTTV